MSWKGLRHKGTEILRASEWNAVIDALDELHDILTKGDKDINVDEVYARTAHFKERPDVAGRTVILDGDPINVAEFHDKAITQITEAMNNAKLTIADILDEAIRKIKNAINETEIVKLLRASGRISTELENVEVPGNGSIEVVKTFNVVRDWFSVSVKVTFPTTASNAVKLCVLYSPNGVDYDSLDAATCIDVGPKAGASLQKTERIPLKMPYVKLLLLNPNADAVIVNMWTWFVET